MSAWVLDGHSGLEPVPFAHTLRTAIAMAADHTVRLNPRLRFEWLARRAATLRAASWEEAARSEHLKRERDELLITLREQLARCRATAAERGARVHLEDA